MHAHYALPHTVETKELNSIHSAAHFSDLTLRAGEWTKVAHLEHGVSKIEFKE